MYGSYLTVRSLAARDASCSKAPVHSTDLAELEARRPHLGGRGCLISEALRSQGPRGQEEGETLGECVCFMGHL